MTVPAEAAAAPSRGASGSRRHLVRISLCQGGARGGDARTNTHQPANPPSRVGVWGGRGVVVVVVGEGVGVR